MFWITLIYPLRWIESRTVQCHPNVQEWSVMCLTRPATTKYFVRKQHVCFIWRDHLGFFCAAFILSFLLFFKLEILFFDYSGNTMLEEVWRRPFPLTKLMPRFWPASSMCRPLRNRLTHPAWENGTKGFSLKQLVAMCAQVSMFSIGFAIFLSFFCWFSCGFSAIACGLWGFRWFSVCSAVVACGQHSFSLSYRFVIVVCGQHGFLLILFWFSVISLWPALFSHSSSMNLPLCNYCRFRKRNKELISSTTYAKVRLRL